MRGTTKFGCLVALFAVAPALADDPDLTPERVGKIQYQEQQATEKLDAEYGNRKPSELTQDERRDYVQKQQEALEKVHQDNGVSDKDYARYTARMSPDERAAAKGASKNAEREDLRKELKSEEEREPSGPKVVPFEKTAAVASPAPPARQPAAPPKPNHRTPRAKKQPQD